MIPDAADWWRHGFVRVPRTILKPSPPQEPACRAWALVDLLGLAECFEGHAVPRGSLDVTHSMLAGRWRWSVDTLRRFLAELVESGIIKVESGTGRRPTRITFVAYDPPRDAVAHPQSFVGERLSPRPRHPQGDPLKAAVAHPQSLVGVGLLPDGCGTTVSVAHPQSLAGVGESSDGAHPFLKKTDAIRRVMGSSGSRACVRACACGRVSLKPGEATCSTCRLEREAADWRAGEVVADDEYNVEVVANDEYNVEIERTAIQEADDDER